ncbi:MAG: hypothetical protein JO080_01490 [Mucilaginibacter sp.]|nr:hypothetical protein [Mucilaginibacter sp.]
MKLIASILVLYFGLLIIQPLYGMDMAKSGKCAAGMCCKEKAHHNSSKPCGSTSCNSDFCNPFVPCGISVVSRFVQFKFNNPLVELTRIEKPSINDHIVSNYLSDCWRPPRLS